MRMSIGYLEPLVFLLFFFGVTFVHANLCQPANFYNYSQQELQRKTIFFFKFLAGVELATSESAVQYLIHWATAANLNFLLQKLIFNSQASSQGPHIFSRCYVSHGNGLITCYEGTFRELGAVQLSPLANRKPLRYENKPRAGASSIVACLVLTQFSKMF